MNRRLFLLALPAAVGSAATASAQVRPPPDPSNADHPALADTLSALNRRNWRALTSLVRALPPQSACMLIDDLGDVSEVDSRLDGLAREAMGATVAGGLQVGWAWRYRGSGFASSVGPSAFAAFQQHLQLARDQLAAALLADANDGVAASLMIRTQKGLQDLPAVDEAFRKFELASRRPIAGYSGYAEAISGKWYGSQERMLGFARQHRSSLMPASQALIPQAHIETTFYLSRSSNPEVATRAANYLNGEFVRGEIVAANDAFHAAAPDPDNYANRFAYGQFSFAFVRMGERELARPHVIGMGLSPAGPWALMPDARRLVQQLRQELGLTEL